MIGERIKKIRQNANLTQQEFADRLKIKRGAIANYEIGRNTPIDAVVSLICREFNVNEDWLRTGEGDMYQQVSIEDELASIFGTVIRDDTSARSRMVRAFAKLPEKYYPILEEAILEYAKSCRKKNNKSAKHIN